MELSVDQILVCFTVLFAVIDIVGSIPVILEVKNTAGSINALKTSIISFSLMIVFLIAGERLIVFLGASKESFAVAGALVLFIMALEMILGIQIFKSDEQAHKAASIVPLAFPLVAGTGAMTTILSLRAEYEAINIGSAIFLNIVVVYIVLRLTSKIEKILGEVGVVVVKKFFGIILLAIAVKLFGTNVPVIFSR